MLSPLRRGIFLIYPQVASTTLLIFSCTPLEHGTQWLAADYRIQCWTGTHLTYVGVGAFWTLVRGSAWVGATQAAPRFGVTR